MIPDLAVDHLASQTPLANTSQLADAIVARPYAYELARRRLGLTTREYAEFNADVRDDTRAVSYGTLPRHIDAMVGRRADGSIYTLRNVVVPAGTPGWIVRLRDGVVVFVPRECGNLSADVAARRGAQPFKNTSFAGYFPPQPVTFAPVAPPLAPAPGGDVTPIQAMSAPEAAPQRKGFAAWWLAIPVAAAAVIGGSGGGSATIPVTIPPCSAGSNAMGVCQRP